ncbi:MAG: methyltransferase domain-containing protein [Gammaproteobacteria bacterium]
MKGPPDALEAQIIRSWNTNARPWARAIQAASIHSRKLVTDAAIVDAVLSIRPGRVFDLGCGEGWLARALSASGIEVTGVDAVPELIAEAEQRGGGLFQVSDYGAIAHRQLQCGPFDAAVCNFSLLGEESVESLLGAVAHYLDAAGHLVVQTLHPAAACGEHPYRDGWRAGSWSGFGAEFSDPAPWYFRTLASWVSMLRRNGFEILECREPTARDAIAPASVIFICKTCIPGAD